MDKELPLSNVHILLGTDLAGQLPLPNLAVYNKPFAEEHFDVFKNVLNADDKCYSPDKVKTVNETLEAVNVMTRSRMKENEERETNITNLKVTGIISELIT